MNKQFFSIILFSVLLVSTISYSPQLQSPIIAILNKIKSSYLSMMTSIDETLTQHFLQQQTIIKLQQQLKEYEKNKLLLVHIASQLNDLYQINDTNMSSNTNVTLVRALSFEKFGDFNRLWLDNFKDFQPNHIYGLSYKNLVAGIVISSMNQPLALLNTDKECSYGVLIGKEKAPGIIHGTNNETLVVDFIPSWYKIAVDDEVITSGLDTIFFKGLRVGKVVAVQQAQGYKSATVMPYYNSKEPNYFYIIKETP